MSQPPAPVVQIGLVAAAEARALEDGLVQPPADDDGIVAATR